MKDFYKSNKIIFILLAISLIIIFAYIFSIDMPERFPFAKELFNLASQFSIAYVTSLIFYMIVNYIPEKRKRDKYRKIALNQLTSPIDRHIRIFQYMYKSVLQEKPKQQFKFVNQLFSEDFFRIIENFDFMAYSPLVPQRKWIDYIIREFQIFDKSLDDIINKYAYFFEDSELQIMENMRSAVFMRILTNRVNVRQYIDGAWFEIENQIEQVSKAGNGISALFHIDQQGRHHFKEYIDLLLLLVKFHDENVEGMKIRIDEKLWSETIAPKYKDTANNN